MSRTRRRAVGALPRPAARAASAHLGALSFHETKNVSCGEGGALLVNDERFVERAEIVHEKGTDRSRFFRGQVDKYTWVDVGSSYALSELAAAYLWAQLERGESDHGRAARDLEALPRGVRASSRPRAWLRRPVVPGRLRRTTRTCTTCCCPTLETRTAFIDGLGRRGVHAVFHYVPLHSSDGRPPVRRRRTEICR